MSGQADRQKAMYGDIAANSSAIPLDFEWGGFVKRNSNVLINPNAAPPTMEGVSFPNQSHRATKPLVEGSLERKSRGIGMGYKSGYYAVSPAGYLHQFKDNDNYHSDPTPEVSLFLPDSTIGAVDGQKFTIKSKDSSGNKLSQKMSMSSEFQFKAHTSSDAEKWHQVISAQTQATTASLPTSPTESRDVTPIQTRHQQQPQEQGIAGGEMSAAPTSAGPQSATATSPGAGQALSPQSAPAPNQLGERDYASKQ